MRVYKVIAGPPDYVQVKRLLSSQGQASEVAFNDDTVKLAGLIVGVDGVRSVVRPCILGNSEKCKPRYR